MYFAWRWSFWALSILLFLGFGSARAALIETAKIPGSDVWLVTVIGDLKSDDIQQFQTRTNGLEKAIVAFGSDGGSLLAGIRIGTTIRLKNYTTVVLNDLRCASACAIAWLGGTRRLMGPNAKIGFHAAYAIKNGEAKEVGAANALLGAYLGNLGLPERAIFYITQASPASMTWLAPQDADLQGIEVSILNLSPSQKPSPRVAAIPEGKEAKQDTDRLKVAVRQFIKKVFSIASASPSEIAAEVPNLYALYVRYYGKHIDRQAVLEDKLHFTTRWPERKYTATDDRIGIACEQQTSSCQVSGVVEWEAHNNRADSTGSSKFFYEVKCVSGRCEITEEKGEVLGRDFRKKTAPRVANVSAIVRQLSGYLTLKNYPTFEAFISSNFDNVVGLKFRVEKSNENDRLQASDDNGKSLAIYLKGEPAFEFVLNNAFTFEHGGYVVDGFFLVKSGGMHQGTISLGLIPVDEAQIRMSKQIRQVTLSE